MSTRGSLTAINRNGINRVRDVSILRKASFEETTDVLFGAAVFSEFDMLRGVSERIIFGESVKIGTGSFQVMADRDLVGDYNIKPKKDREHEA
jgi:DNA-directed RNA polymerase beta' subunit